MAATHRGKRPRKLLSAAIALPAGHRLLWYQLEEVLLTSRFGITYLATDTNLHRTVVLREYFPGELARRAEDGGVRARGEAGASHLKWGLDRFLREARIIARLKNPHLVAVFTAFEANNTGYFAMEHCAGPSLKEGIGTAPYDEARVRTLLGQLLGAIEKIHQARFLHLSIKPANVIMRRPAWPVLVGFGAARCALAHRLGVLTEIIDPDYAAIEQYAKQANKQTRATDIFALGVLAYEAMTGELPVAAVKRHQGIRKGADPYVPLARRCAGAFAPEFLEAVDWALRYHRSDRPQSIAEWQQGLNLDLAPSTAPEIESELFEPAGTAAGPASEGPTVHIVPASAAKPRRRGLRLGVLLAVLLATVALGYHLGWRRPGVEQRRAENARSIAPTGVAAEVASIRPQRYSPDPAAARHLSLAEVALELASGPADVRLAEREIEKALAIDARYARAHLLLGTAQQRLGEPASAREHLRQVLALDNDPEAVRLARERLSDARTGEP